MTRSDYQAHIAGIRLGIVTHLKPVETLLLRSWRMSILQQEALGHETFSVLLWSSWLGRQVGPLRGNPESGILRQNALETCRTNSTWRSERVCWDISVPFAILGKPPLRPELNYQRC